ncbi:MAG: hypothetical protein DMG36_19070 [Acidobacteria bacterium]|nr:MAG: hypothetical protein DMG36_19070 [Acidobacteriota bacterium]
MRVLTTSFVLTLLFLTTVSARAQESPTQPPTAPPKIDPAGELDKLKESCGAFKIMGCAEELFTGKPVHIAAGSIAPQNGFGAGIAYLGHKTTDNWRINWDSDAVGSINGSWRAGLYVKFVDTHEKAIGGGFGTKGRKTRVLSELPEHAVINLYAQAISLDKLTYFGLGPATTLGGRSFYGMREIIGGLNAVKPFYQRLNASLFGEINGRFVDIRPSTNQPSPTIGALYTEATAPGLTSQPGTVQLGEGIQIRPTYFEDFLRLNYRLAYQQYFAPGNSNFSFQRLTVDLSHQFVIYKKTTRYLLPRDNNPNGPDDCSLSTDPAHPECAAITRDMQGTIDLRFFLAASMTPGGNVVPFYFQSTIGGVDINGNPSLASYQDFRFRAPNVMFFHQGLEHSIWGPLGFSIMAEEGKVGLRRGDLGSNPWIHSFASGLTLRAGGFPQVFLLFAWGGNEGTHTIANVNTSLLGGSGRPSLY